MIKNSGMRPMPALLFPVVLFAVSICGQAILAQDQEAAKETQSDKEVVTLWPNGLPDGAVKLDDKRIEELKTKEAVHPRGHLLYVLSLIHI